MSIFDASSICRRNCTHYCALKKRATNHLNGFCVCTAYNLVQFLCLFIICHAHFTSSRSHNEKFKVHPSRASDILVDRMQWSRSLFVVNRIWIFWSGSVCCIITYMHIENCNKFSGILGVSLQTTMQIMSVVTEQHVHSFTHTHTQRHNEIRINENCIFVSAIFHKTSDKLFWLCRKPTMKLVRNFVASMLCICGFETKVFQFRELEISINGLHKWRQRRRQTNPMKENALAVEKLQMAHLNLLSRSNSHSQT